MSIVIALPLDLTGTNPVNHILSEEHRVTGLEDAIFSVDYGPFYTDGLKVFSVTLNRYLVPVTEFIPLHYYEEPSLRSGREVCVAIYIKSPAHYGTYNVEYHAVGGEFVHVLPIIEQLINNLAIDQRPVQWGNLIGAPDTFPPANHLHDLGDLYGFEYLTEALDRIADLILVGDQASHEEIYDFMDHLFDGVTFDVVALTQRINSHEESNNNPHNVTKAQVGLGSVQNYGVASKVQAEAGALNNLYMTPLRTQEAIASQALPVIADHVSNSNNPHNVTKAQVGLGSVQNYGVASTAETIAGTANRYVSASGYLAATTQFINTAVTALEQIIASGDSTNAQAISTHVNNTNNPHSVTKAQVGLSLVQNYGIASKAQAEAGTDNNVYMTPLRTNEAIQKLASGTVGEHVNNTNNPHNVTKAQVGLGSVQNYGIATQQQAQDMSANNVYMTPQGVGYAIAGTVTSLSNHVNNTNNPHNVTKAQVGLSLVQNYGIATSNQAQTMQDNNVYMTPLRTKEAMTNYISTLNTHVGNVSNPHNVTKTQLGLGLVENYGIATQQQATTGTANNVYMTPLRTKEAIDSVVSTAIGNHTSATNNPHNVTKAQVGLSLVQNYGIATAAQAQDGNNNTTYMTPSTTNTAIDAKLNAFNPNLWYYQVTGYQTSTDGRAVIGRSIQGLTPGATYLIMVDGISTYNGTGNHTRYGTLIRDQDSNGAIGNIIASTPSLEIDQPDGNANVSATFVVVANQWGRFWIETDVRPNNASLSAKDKSKILKVTVVRIG